MHEATAELSRLSRREPQGKPIPRRRERISKVKVTGLVETPQGVVRTTGDVMFGST